MNPYIIPGIPKGAPRIPPRRVLDTTIEYFNLKADSVFRCDRTTTVVKARHIIFWILSNRLHLNVQDICQFIQQDRTTVKRAIKRVDSELNIYDDINADLNNILGLLKLSEFNKVQAIQN